MPRQRGSKVTRARFCVAPFFPAHLVPLWFHFDTTFFFSTGRQWITMDKLPSARYTSPTERRDFTLTGVGKEHLYADGKTTGPSLYLLESTQGHYIDNDRPAPLDLDSEMGVLRGYITKLQDDINEYLTDKIKASESAEVDDKEEEAEEEEEEEEDDSKSG